VTLRRGAGLKTVLPAVARTLRRAGIEAVLTGGANAALYAGGTFHSYDLDFILRRTVRRDLLDAAMKDIGFERRGDHYASPDQDYLVEFPPGPLAIGSDTAIRPVHLRVGGTIVLALSATDSCLDRLAAWIHWRDKGSRQVALEIATRSRVRLARIREWCRREDAEVEGERFLADRRARLAARRTRR
jgi:hypothetical protein